MTFQQVLNNGGADPLTNRGRRSSIPRPFHWVGNLYASGYADTGRAPVHSSSISWQSSYRWRIRPNMVYLVLCSDIFQRCRALLVAHELQLSLWARLASGRDRWPLNTGGNLRDRSAASFLVVRHTLRLATSNNRRRFSCSIVQGSRAMHDKWCQSIVTLSVRQVATRGAALDLSGSIEVAIVANTSCGPSTRYSSRTGRAYRLLRPDRA